MRAAESTLIASLHFYTYTQKTDSKPLSILYSYTIYTLIITSTHSQTYIAYVFWVLPCLHWEKYLSHHLPARWCSSLFVYRRRRWRNVEKDVSPGGFYLEKSWWQPADPFKTQLHLFPCMLIVATFLHSNYISVSMETLTSKHIQKNNNRFDDVIVTSES